MIGLANELNGLSLGGIGRNTEIDGGYAPVYVARRVADNRFQIAGGDPGLEVSWQINATRNDPYARAHPYQDIVEKESAERGRYHYPAGYGMPEDMSTSRIPAEEVASLTASDGPAMASSA